MSERSLPRPTPVRTRPNGRVRRGLGVNIARSQVIQRGMRLAVNLVLLVGFVFISWGLIEGVSRFTAGMAILVDPSRLDASASALIPNTSGEGFVPYRVEQSAMQQAGAPDLPVMTWPTPPMDLPTTGPEAPAQALAGGAPAGGAGAVAAAALAATEAPTQTAGPTLTPQPTATPQPTFTPLPPAPPDRIVIPSIGLNAPVQLAPVQLVSVQGRLFEQWDAPKKFAAGWQEGSARLGEPGNTVLNGHHNIDGEVFGHLYQLKRGAEITIYSGDRAYTYLVSQVMKLAERDVSLAQREENARWIMPSTDERLTLVTCWPPTSNTDRIIVVAVPYR